ncbi:hypothetical protein UPYG_G00093370 [Umbra pygmaea]|uniref:Uncharacterized protein n=1 Tax=Umbra pygmaea TaxID=75934 RepID=A0ABD0WZB2_UMBPY
MQRMGQLLLLLPPCYHQVIPMVRMIQHNIALKLTGTTNPTAAGLGAKLLRVLKARQCPETIHLIQAATILDPRFKTVAFSNQDKANDAVRYVTAECAKLIKTPTTASTPPTPHLAPDVRQKMDQRHQRETRGALVMMTTCGYYWTTESVTPGEYRVLVPMLWLKFNGT